MPVAQPVEYRGIVYKSIHRLCDTFDVDYGTFYARRKRGMTVEEALTTEKRYHRKVEISGHTYPTKMAACRALGISYHTVKSRRDQLGLTFEEAILWKPGVTIGEECKEAGVLRWTYWARRKRGWSKEQALGNENPPKTDPSPRNEAILLHNYGLTIREYEGLVAEKEGNCWICGDEASPPCIDHSHQTGKVRGILCRGCNSGLGRFHDDPVLLRKAIQYLETSS